MSIAPILKGLRGLLETRRNFTLLGSEIDKVWDALPALFDCAEALEKMTARYVELAGSGDCGNWNPEDEDEVKVARAALTKLRGTP